jgi:hypothetical protein
MSVNRVYSAELKHYLYDGVEKVKTNITLEQALKAQTVSRRIVLLFFQHRHYMGWWSTPLPGCLTQGRIRLFGAPRQ